MRFLRWLLGRFDRPSAAYWVVGIALFLSLPALGCPLVADDITHAKKWNAWMSGVASPESGGHILNDYFRFVPGNAAWYEHQLKHGIGAWWTTPDLKLAFWRPLSAAAHSIDHVLWHGNSWLMHLHTLIWYAALLLALNCLYRRFLAPTTATLALAVYAWDDAHGMLLSWVANRNALIAAVFGVVALIVHDRWIRDEFRHGVWLGPVVFAMALLAGEIGLSTLGYLCGHAAFVDRSRARIRLLRLTPYLILVVLWQILYSRAGYGAVGTGFYVHPLHEPLRFALQMAERVPVLALSQLTPFPADPWFLFPLAVKAAILPLGLGVVALLAWVAWPRLRADRDLRCWVAGAVFAFLPISVTFPSERNMIFVGIGIAPLLASVFVSEVEHSPVSRTSRFVILTFAAFHLVLAPLALPVKSLSTFGMNSMLTRSDADVPSGPSIVGKTLVFVRTESEAWLAFNLSRRETLGIPKPKALVLGLTLSDVSVQRIDDRTLRLRATNGFLDSPIHRLTRGLDRPFHVGDVIEPTGMTVTVMDVTPDARPQTVEFRFSTPLESEPWIWMRGKGMAAYEWKPPAVGETVLLRRD